MDLPRGVDAARRGSRVRDDAALERLDLSAVMLDLIADPNVRSREEWVRQYDHEVQARSVVKPFVGRRRDGPSDGAVLPRPPRLHARHHRHARHLPALRGPRHLRHGAVRRGRGGPRARCPWRGSGPDGGAGQLLLAGPRGRPRHAGRGVQARPARARVPRPCRCLPCLPAAAHLGQGLDEERRPDRREKDLHPARRSWCRSWASSRTCGRRRRPTSRRRAISSTSSGRPGASWAAPALRRQLGRRLGPCPAVRLGDARGLYRRLHAALRRGLVRSCHDLSDGGLWAALAESCLGGDCGADISLDDVPLPRQQPNAMSPRASCSARRRRGSS